MIKSNFPKDYLTQTPPAQIATDIIEFLPKTESKLLLQLLSDKFTQTKAKIYYCGELDAPKRKIILDFLAKKTNANFEPEFIEDKSLIGGIKIQYQDFIFDTSLLRKLWNN